MRLKQQTKRRHTRRKFLIGLFSLLTITAVSTKLSLANADIAALVESWFQRKAEVVLNDIDKQIHLETEIQKQRLMEEIELRMAAADQSINRFTEEQKLLYKSSLQSYADELIANLDFSNEEDRRRIEAILEPILSSARAAMDDLAQNYTPPAVEQPTPEPTEEAPPAAETPAPAESEAPSSETTEPAPAVPEEPSAEPAEPAPAETPATEEAEVPPSTETTEIETETQAPAAETDPASEDAAPVTIID